VTAANTPWNSIFFNIEGVIVVSHSARMPYGYIPSWIVIQNLHVQNADPANTLTQSDGTVTNFDTFATSIYVEFAQHLVVRGCELNGSCNGFFCNSKNGDTNELSADMLIENCWIHGNGYAGNYGVHNIYTESKGVTFQYNLIGPLRPGADGEQIKDRSSGTILRYNMIVQGPGPGTAFWFEQTQGGIGIIDVDPAYRTNFVYGNVFFNTPDSQGLIMFRYDALGIQGQPRNGTLYFYNNTVVNYANQSARYYTYLFQLPSHAEVLQWNVHDVVDCRNNVFAALPVTAGRPPSLVSLLGSDDSTINFGTNWVSPGTQLIALPYLATNFWGTLTGTNQLIHGDNKGQNNPGFLSLTATNLHLLSSSPAIDAAGPQSPAVLASTNNLTFEYVYPAGFQNRAVNGLGPDLGAFEGTSTNFSGPLFTLVVSNGFGSGSYPAGAVVPIVADAAPAGQAFGGWTGFAVSNPSLPEATLTMPSSNLTVTATFTNLPVPANYPLSVVNGAGSGSYLPGTVVEITANTPPGGETFAGWSGYPVANSNAASTTLTMPAADVIVTANYQATNGFLSTIPFPVATHPRLWITTNDLPRLRSWATPANPVYQAVRTLLTDSMNNYDTRYFPGGVQNTNWPDFGDTQGYTGLLTEEDAFVFALFSLVDPDPTQRALYAQRAANLIRVAMTQAAKGSLAGAPFRDPEFATYNRANASLETMPLAVDWVYNATGANGQPVLSAADKLTIRNGFLVWAEACRHASTTGGDSPPPDVVNDPSQLCPNHAAYRMAANNYYLGHARMLTLMSLAIDPTDDPPLNPKLPVSAPTNSLRSYISIATGAWLFQEYAMFGEGAQVAADYGLPGYGANFGLANGGMPPEGMLYGHSLGFMLSQLLALQTAGFNNPDFSGPQCKLIGAPLWERFCDAWLSALMPAPAMIEDYLPPAYQMMGYGDILRLYMTPDFSEIYSLLMSLDSQTGITNRLAKTRWLALEAPQGGYSDLLNRVSIPWGNAEGNQSGVLYFLTLDPATLAPPADPRPALPTLFYDRSQSMLVGQSDWTTNRSMLHWRCSWISINHQNGDGGMFQFFRKGEFLTKEYSGYDATGYGQASWLHNTLALQNHCPAGTPANLQWFETGLWATGSQWQLGEDAGDPLTSASGGPDYVFTGGDLTPLYNRPSPWTPENAALDILHASRSLLWLKPDHLVIYDRATSQTAGLFKRFNLCLPAAPAVTALPGGGSFLTETMAGGQQLFIHSLLPSNGTVSINSLSGVISSVAEGEPCNYRLAIQDTNNPADLRFLHVLQGADAGTTADPATYVQSSGGNAFEGAVVRGLEVLFPVNVLSNNFTSVSYSAPAGVTSHYIAGLAPNAKYAVTVLANAGQLHVTVAPGTRVTADNAGLLAFDNAGQPLHDTSPQWLSARWVGDTLQLTGAGGPLLPYQVQACTNLDAPYWTPVGAATADTGGTLQYNDSTAANSGQRFYRLAR
jgi:hypothetical protein